MSIAQHIAALVLLTATADACMRVTPANPGMPAVPCKTCAAELIDVHKKGEGAEGLSQDMTDDKISTAGACAVRTFTCTGKQASIQMWNVEGEVGLIGDRDTGTATAMLTCNAAGTAWVFEGMPVTVAECAYVPSCKTCAANLIDVHEEGQTENAQQMTDDKIDTAGACSKRTFTCTGVTEGIEVFRDGQSIGNFGPMEAGMLGTTTVTVECNAAGTAWELLGNIITEVECSYRPHCQECLQEWITKVGNVIDTTYGVGCSMREFQCMGNGAEIIASTADGLQKTIGDGSDLAKYAVTCNKAGTGWEDQGAVITKVECKTKPVGTACKDCTIEMLNKNARPGADGAKDFATDDIDQTGACLKRILKCRGRMAGVEFYAGGVRLASHDTPGNELEVTLTCNAAGTAWSLPPFDPVDGLQCASLPG